MNLTILCPYGDKVKLSFHYFSVGRLTNLTPTLQLRVVWQNNQSLDNKSVEITRIGVMVVKPESYHYYLTPLFSCSLKICSLGNQSQLLTNWGFTIPRLKIYLQFSKLLSKQASTLTILIYNFQGLFGCGCKSVKWLQLQILLLQVVLYVVWLWLLIKKFCNYNCNY